MESFYLRFRKEESDRYVWVRRSAVAVSLAWAKAYLFECATRFTTAAEAKDFAKKYRIAGDVELVTIHTEAADAA